MTDHRKSAPLSVDDALDLVARRRRPPEPFGLARANALAGRGHRVRAARRRARLRAVVVGVGLLTLSGCAFAAVGGIGILRSFVLRVELDGRVVGERELVLDHDGVATMTVPVTAGGEISTVSFAMEATETGPSAAGEAGVEIELITVGSGQARIQVRELRPTTD